MLSWLQMLIFSLFEGVTCILPISNSGVLFTLRRLMGFSPSGDSEGLFLPVCQILLAVMVALTLRSWWRKSLPAVTPSGIHRISAARLRRQMSSRMLLLGGIAVIPVLIGFLLKGKTEPIIGRLPYVVMILTAGGMVQFTCDRIGCGQRSVAETTILDAFLIGAFHALGVIPGLCAPGLGITMGIWRGLDPEFSVMFSFMVMVPTLFIEGAAGVISAANTAFQWPYLLGWALCCVCGFGALRIIRAAARKQRIGEFAYPVWGTALFLLVLYLFS